MGVSERRGRAEVIRSGGGKWACLGEEDQAVPGSSWRLLTAPGGSWEFLVIPELLGAPSGYRPEPPIIEQLTD